jgi:NitT/TauT family transport system permease protein
MSTPTTNASARSRTKRATSPTTRRLKRPTVLFLQIAVLVAILAAWQWVPKIMAVRHVVPAFDPFFVSSPQQVAIELSKLLNHGAPGKGVPDVRPYLAYTLKGMVVGGALGIALGMALGLLFSHSEPARQVFSPFIHALNAMPRIALIPIFIIMFGATLKSSVITAVVVVFFAVFYNAYSGGSSVPREMMQNAALLGASPLDMMLKIRFRYVLVWTFAAIPNAISLALISVVTAEILSGSGGVGRLIVSALSLQDATLVFSLVILLSVLGLIFVTIADVARRRVLHWWPGVTR